MDDGKKAAKALIVDKYFPQPSSSKFNDVLSDLFPPISHQEYSRNQGYEGQSSKAQNATAGDFELQASEGCFFFRCPNRKFRRLQFKNNILRLQCSFGYSQGEASKSHNTPKNTGNAVVYCEVLEACSMSSSVDYGCRDNYYPNAHANQQPGSSYEKKDKKDDYECPDPEHSRGEWWQGSLYY